MERKYLALNCALFFWLLALVAWCFASTSVAWLTGALSLLTFIAHFLAKKINTMFKKYAFNEPTQPTITPPAPVIEKEPSAMEKHGTTVIASDVRFEGNIVSNGHVYIHGTLIGNIDAKESLIKVMRGGTVEGNILCRELIIDGTILGQCQGDIIEICENGKVTGSLTYHTLAVKKGGLFTGQADVLPTVAEKCNVVGLLQENLPEKADAPTAKEKQK